MQAIQRGKRSPPPDGVCLPLGVLCPDRPLRDGSDQPLQFPPFRIAGFLEPVPALRLAAGDTVSEWVNTHEMARHRGGTYARMPAGSWPVFLAAFVAGQVRVSRFTPKANPTDLLVDHEPEEALARAWERYEAYIRAEADRPRSWEVAW